MRVLIGAPICPGKEYSINEWAEWIATQDYENVEVCLCVNGDEHDECDEFAEKLRQLEIGDKKVFVLNSPYFGGTVFQKLHPARDIIRLFALNGGYDALLWLDTDTVPIIKNALTKLLSWNECVVSGLYFYKKSRVPVALNPKTGKNFTVEELEVASTKLNIIRAHSVGLGCVLMTREVLENIAFDWNKYEDRIGEDFMICEEITDAGYTIFLDPWVTCRHYGPGDFKIE